jgi:hypothetical protein
MKRIRVLVPAWVLLFTFTAGHSAAEAQETPAIAALEAAAVASGNHGLWGPAAALFARAAALRTFGDEGAVSNLRVAAFLRYYAGDREQALRLISGAAAEAVASGQFFMAAESYLDGAWIALQMDLVPTARQFAETAALIAESPNLRGAESRWILARLGEAGPIARLSER